MHKLKFALLAIFAAVTALLASATQDMSAAPHLVGDYNISIPDGPVIGELYVDPVDSSVDDLTGTVVVDGSVLDQEELHFTPNPNGGWFWENARGSTGVIFWDGEKFVSVVESGRFAGTTRHITPQVPTP
ncbi:MAG: hypothetical protein AAFU73_21915 [Planctomycetota bacterium]